MARRREVRGQTDTIRRIVIFSGIIGVLVLIGAIASGVRLSPDWQVKSNPSDQPSVSSAPANKSRETTGDNAGASRNATREGSGPSGSGTGSPQGSSGNVQGSTPQGGERSGVAGSSTR